MSGAAIVTPRRVALQPRRMVGRETATRMAPVRAGVQTDRVSGRGWAAPVAWREPDARHGRAAVSFDGTEPRGVQCGC